LFDGKLKESIRSTLPVIWIVVILCLTIAPLPTDLMLCFLLGAVLVILGITFFNIGAESAMTPVGSYIGSAMTETRKLSLILAFSFFLGFAVTVAEPDLQVLAQTVPHISNSALVLTVGIGVGFFLTVCMLRILFNWRLRWLLMFIYSVIFALAAFADSSFLCVAFDAGGVTTGPMTVPFILAFGMGVSRIRSDRRAEADSFGLVALCSTGPILAVLILGFTAGGQEVSNSALPVSFENSAQVGRAYLEAFPIYMKEMVAALLPIMAIFVFFQVLFLKLPMRTFGKIAVGFLYTLLGLALFLTGVNVGFSALGGALGAELAEGWTKYLLIPLSMLLGWFIISAEPAVAVLEEQIEEVSAGAIPGRAIRLSLKIAISMAMGISALRVITGLSLLYFLIPGYVTALLMTLFVPDIYTAIAFDAGGVASGPMTATFMLQLIMGAGSALGSNILKDAFGVVAMVAMMPLLSIQMLGVLYRKKNRDIQIKSTDTDDEVVELWEVAV